MDRAVPLQSHPGPSRGPRPLSRVPPVPAPAAVVRVFLADPHEVIQLGLRLLLDATDDLALVGVGPSCEDAVRAVSERWADVVLIDQDLDGAGGTRISRELSGIDGAPHCFLISRADPAVVAELSRQGAAGFLHKRAAGRHLVEALRRLPGEGLILDPIMSEVLLANLLGPSDLEPAGELSERELELLRLLGEGRTNREIADTIYLSEKTVKNYLSRLFRKLGVRSRTEAALLSARYQSRLVATSPRA